MIVQQGRANLWSFGAAQRPRAWPTLVSVFLIGMLLGTAVTGAATVAIGRSRGLDQPAAVVRAWPERPLPRAWRWSPPVVKVDRMFRKSVPYSDRVSRRR